MLKESELMDLLVCCLVLCKRLHKHGAFGSILNTLKFHPKLNLIRKIQGIFKHYVAVGMQGDLKTNWETRGS